MKSRRDRRGGTPGEVDRPEADQYFRAQVDATAQILGARTVDEVGSAACLLHAIRFVPLAREKRIRDLAAAIRIARATGREIQMHDVLTVLDADHLGANYPDVADAMGVLYSIDDDEIDALIDSGVAATRHHGGRNENGERTLIRCRKGGKS